jgi:hypothetical protein
VMQASAGIGTSTTFQSHGCPASCRALNCATVTRDLSLSLSRSPPSLTRVPVLE